MGALIEPTSSASTASVQPFVQGAAWGRLGLFGGDWQRPLRKSRELGRRYLLGRLPPPLTHTQTNTHSHSQGHCGLVAVWAPQNCRVRAGLVKRASVRCGGGEGGGGGGIVGLITTARLYG